MRELNGEINVQVNNTLERAINETYAAIKALGQLANKLYFDKFPDYQKALDWSITQGDKEAEAVLRKAGDFINQYGNFSIGELLESLTPEELVKLKEIPEIWKLVPKAIQDAINSLGEYLDKSGEVKKINDEMFTGTSFDALKDSLDELVKQADLTFEDISKSFSGHMGKAILEMVKRRELSDKLRDWYGQFSEAMSDNELTAGEAEELRRVYEEIVRNANKKYKAAMNVIGEDNGSGDENTPDDNTLKGAYAKASQESIDLLAGQSGAMRVILEQMLALEQAKSTVNQVQLFSPLFEGLAAIRELQTTGWKDVAIIKELSMGIADTNKQIAESNERVAVMSKNVSENTDKIAKLCTDAGQNGWKIRMPGIG
ncbi:hypothetical protein FACS1894181_18760 [Bacteroidia bacterium]|nr:hypothetical protein FACS1894181_18760 [Bacteroidia bacterium]